MEGEASAVSLPKVIANFAVTWDGRISTRKQTPSDFSSPEDKRRLLQIRAEGDAVLVSAATVAADTMTLGLPDAELRRQRVERGQREFPLRVVVSGSGEIDPALRLFASGGELPLIYSTQRMPEAVRRSLETKADLRLEEGPWVDLSRMLASLSREFGVKTVVFEGGGMLFGQMLRSGLVDELCLTLCPLVFGGSGGVSLTGRAGGWLPESVSCHLMGWERVGEECFTRWRIKK
ncbi:MAG: 2,5-diamino-6-ribosylamino-4(3H)-pyrimidinone 5-phosphate reductase [Verrucomicrobiota bacterium]|jgi:riboflavin-specific deaminase-like protein